MNRDVKRVAGFDDISFAKIADNGEILYIGGGLAGLRLGKKFDEHKLFALEARRRRIGDVVGNDFHMPFHHRLARERD